MILIFYVQSCVILEVYFRSGALIPLFGMGWAKLTIGIPLTLANTISY
jgi:hypothetical protein